MVEPVQKLGNHESFVLSNVGPNPTTGDRKDRVQTDRVQIDRLLYTVFIDRVLVDRVLVDRVQIKRDYCTLFL